ncbi:transaldolase [Oleiphilus sp. HI0071]|jgi:transaldolase|uniref:transaldolase n=2 Tax=unclassified Oleiphilus TaxID=2631174 RepID=UPI0007C3EB44|nr:transaldolase [Oleiphilus sp. HI0079]KZY63673.1 transaldolase [Oleiphilus sp. HI0065]KZY83030.1 transaldolase [Oleiphilus sp. HI0071]KZY98775.1 transaldolase [Oleiphilus sp. HI0073]KZZ53958.1 transaldolase [Oleiphilus sp. HI0122]KZZ71006.1 transaldolase [Oleiphilus sp. HI0130]KZZ77978.1 transaldolase [Oleiphilus sp. HI0133]
MASKLEQLRTMTTVVADTGDLQAIKQWKPEDATTNPSLLLKAAALDEYQPLIADAKKYGARHDVDSQEQLDLACDYLACSIGKEILGHIPGKISTEVDARLSFSTDETVNRALRLIDLYDSKNVATERVLIKIASTWEGIQAAKILQQKGINCNLTLLFDFAQAQAAADAGAFLISPFVGRILDWYKNDSGITDYPANEDPGVLSVQQIYRHYKASGYDTIVMGASFRNTGEIEELAGCDRLTISPQLLEELSRDEGDLQRKLFADSPKNGDVKALSESAFRWDMNESAMATEKLADGIRNFAADQIKLEKLLKA